MYKVERQALIGMLIQKIQGENQKLLTPYIFHFHYAKIHFSSHFTLFYFYKFTSLHYHISPINFSFTSISFTTIFIYHLVIFSLTQPFPSYSFISHILLSVLHFAVVSTFCSYSPSVANPVL